jgi:hypothetical protein
MYLRQLLAILFQNGLSKNPNASKRRHHFDKRRKNQPVVFFILCILQFFLPGALSPTFDRALRALLGKRARAPTTRPMTPPGTLGSLAVLSPDLPLAHHRAAISRHGVNVYPDMCEFEECVNVNHTTYLMRVYCNLLANCNWTPAPKSRRRCLGCVCELKQDHTVVSTAECGRVGAVR